jgi:RimJ/RimL family protein N-acetyltransferase
VTPELRAWRVDDAEDCAEACNDPLIQRFVRHLPQPYTRADALDFIATAGPTQFAIVETGKLLGAAGYTEDGRGSAEVGYWVAPWARRRGVATEALRQIGEFPFDRLVVRTAADNPASQRVAIAAGFTYEGVARGAGRDRDGSRYDLIVWARLKGDPPGPTPRLIPDFPDGRLTDGTVTLRMIVPGDVDDLVALHSLPDVYLHSVPPEPPPREKLAKLADEAETRWLAGQRASLVIEDTATGSYAGDLGVFYHEPMTQQAMLGYSLMPAWRGRGYASRAVRLVSAWAIPALGLARLVAGVEPANVASQRVLGAAGFTRESYERNRLPGPDGTRIDNIQYVLLA